MKRVCVVLAVVSILASGIVLAGEDGVEQNGTRYRTYAVSPEKVSLFWLNPAGKPYRQFRTLQQELTDHAKKAVFMTNAGIFEEGGIPSGLTIIEGKRLRDLNVAEGQGNFYLKPNGVFYINAQQAHIVESSEFAAVKPDARLAVQSGPLLLRNGKIHKAFQASSKNYLHRSGVGVSKKGLVLFAITVFDQKRYPNLYEFAEFFRSQGCSDALFLDGDISQMVVSPAKLVPEGNHFGAIFAVVEGQK